MRKISALLLSFWMCLFFEGCGIFHDILNNSLSHLDSSSVADSSYIEYYGVVETMEENEGYFVNILNGGLCCIPAYEKEQITVKEGDFLVMRFYAEEVIILESYPGRIATPVEYMEAIDFSFSFTWGIYGISSYDSATGKLIKTNDAPVPEEYETIHFLTAKEKLEIFKIIQDLDAVSYPDVYHPTEGSSVPCETLILSMQWNTLHKTITAEEVALTDATTEKGKKFMDACKKIAKILEATEEWKSLPDYPYFYE